MTNEEIARTIQLILSQQAQFAAELQQMEAQFGKLTDAVITVTGMVGKLAEAQVEATTAQARTDAKVAELAAGLLELAQKGKETEERLNTFITVVERYISEQRNGRGGAS
jgi:hypothetical protein